MVPPSSEPLYHEGNGLTVERDKVTVYSELAKILFKNLFGFEIADPSDTTLGGDSGASRLGAFLENWVSLERLFAERSKPDRVRSDRSPLDLARRLGERGDLSTEELASINRLRVLRNQAVHVQDGVREIDDASLTELRNLILRLKSRWQ